MPHIRVEKFKGGLAYYIGTLLIARGRWQSRKPDGQMGLSLHTLEGVVSTTPKGAMKVLIEAVHQSPPGSSEPFIVDGGQA